MKKRDKLRDLYKKCSKKIYISIITSLALFAPANPVFAAGDLIGTKATIAWAAKSGKDAAEAIEQYLE